MESSIWGKFLSFIKASFTQKFKAFMPGCLMGFVGAQHILWVGVSVSLVTYITKYAGTVFMAFGSGLATSYAAYLIEQYKNKKNVQKSHQRKRKGGGTAA